MKKKSDWDNLISDFQHIGKIKECFHYNDNECNGKIKKAHSLQKNGVLSLIEYEVNKNKKVYSFLYPNMIGPFTLYGFKPLGKKEASTFHGFCDFHDSKIFHPIENSEIDIDSDEHCFLLSYRSLAKEFHTKIESLKAYKTHKIFRENKAFQEDYIKGTELAIRDLIIVKNKLNSMLKRKAYGELEYFTYTLDCVIPIACATSITPDYSYNGVVLNKTDDIEDTYEVIILTIIPTKTSTNILFACFPEDKRSILYLDELGELPNLKLENAITSILISEVENTFFSPYIWEQLTEREREFLMQEITLTIPQFQSFQEGFFISSLNLFETRFAVKI